MKVGHAYDLHKAQPIFDQSKTFAKIIENAYLDIFRTFVQLGPGPKPKLWTKEKTKLTVDIFQPPTHLPTKNVSKGSRLQKGPRFGM